MRISKGLALIVVMGFRLLLFSKLSDGDNCMEYESSSYHYTNPSWKEASDWEQLKKTINGTL